MRKQDVVSTKRAIDNYCNADPSFATTRECKFLNAIADAFDAGDAEAFTAEVAEYDRCASCPPPSTIRRVS
jgi:alpha-soluble NSF attachment protein